jgi:hypothetical protein
VYRYPERSWKKFNTPGHHQDRATWEGFKLSNSTAAAAGNFVKTFQDGVGEEKKKSFAS